MRLTNKDPDHELFIHALDKIYDIRRKQFKDRRLAELSSEQKDLLQDILVPETLKNKGEVFSEILDRYTRGVDSHIFDSYKIAKNRMGLLENINKLSSMVSEDKRPELSRRILSKVFEANLKDDSAQDIGGLLDGLGLTPEQVKTMQSVLTNEICQYIDNVFFLDNKEQSLKTKEGMEGVGGTGNKSDSMQKIKEVLEDIKVDKKTLEKCLQIASKLKKVVSNHNIDKEKYSNSAYPDNELNIATVTAPEDIRDILPYQYIYDEIGALELKLVNRELFKKQHQSKNKRKRIFYMLIDASGSMGPLRKTVLILTSAMLSFCIDSRDHFILETFADDIQNSFTATKQEQIPPIIRMLASYFTSGGTDINGALLHAIRNIKSQNKREGVELKDAEIYLITDGDDSVDSRLINNEKKDIRIHTTILNNENVELEKVSTTFNKITGEDKELLKSKSLDLVSVF